MKKILLVEDNDDIRENAAEILELANYHVVAAENGKVGVQKAIEEKPDLIVCDIMMPLLDGYGVLHAIQRNEAIMNTPFIFLTAKSERADFRRGMELGADDYITKPFEGTELLNAIDSRLKKVDLNKKDFQPGLKGLEEIKNTKSPEDIIANRDINVYKKKQTIYAEGNHPRNLFYLVSGKVRTFKIHEDGKSLVTNLFSPGDFFGYVSLFENGVYKETAEAMETSEIAVIPKEEFSELLDSSPEISRRFIRLLASNVATKESQLLGLAYNSLRKKVAEALLTLYRKYGEDEADYKIDITRENLAGIAGTATESLIRTLGDFRHEKLIAIEGGNIRLLNTKKLEQMLN